MSPDVQMLTQIIIIMAALGGIAGGLTAGLIVALARRPQSIDVRAVADQVLSVPVSLQTDPVALHVHTQVAQPDPVVVEVITGGSPTTRELAARVLATMPSIGPTDLSTIVQCSKSTAHAIIQDVRAGRLALPDVPDPDDEGSFGAERGIRSPYSSKST